MQRQKGSLTDGTGCQAERQEGRRVREKQTPVSAKEPRREERRAKIEDLRWLEGNQQIQQCTRWANIQNRACVYKKKQTVLMEPTVCIEADPVDVHSKSLDQMHLNAFRKLLRFEVYSIEERRTLGFADALHLKIHFFIHYWTQSVCVQLAFEFWRFNTENRVIQIKFCISTASILMMFSSCGFGFNKQRHGSEVIYVEMSPCVWPVHSSWCVSFNIPKTSSKSFICSIFNLNIQFNVHISYYYFISILE